MGRGISRRRGGEVATMPGVTPKSKLWALMGLLIFVLLNYPVLDIVNRDTLWGGIPLLVFHLHAVWILALVGLYALARGLASQE